MNNTMITSITLQGIFFLIWHIPFTLAAQELIPGPISTPKNQYEKVFKPFVVLEAWGTYSTGSNPYDAGRTDILLRRLRFGGSGVPYSWLKYDFHFHMDYLGKDPYSASKGAQKQINIWNAYLTGKLLKNSELLNLHVGYFWAAISREYHTVPWSVSSFDKTSSTGYMRNFITGTGNGIESGIGIGGLKNFNQISFSYRAGTYEPQKFIHSKFNSRLYTGRVMFSFGVPEQVSYSYMLSGSDWGRRKGITIGLGGSTQSNGRLNDSVFFDKSIAYGADVLISYMGLRIDGEYFLFNRSWADLEDYNGHQYHLRTSYMFKLSGQFIQPAILYSSYSGEGSENLYSFIGGEIMFDVGINWYLNEEKLKVSFHYVIQDGTITKNSGDFIGMAFQLKI